MRLRTSAVALLLMTTGCMGTYSQTEVGVAANATTYSSSGSVSVSYFYDRLEPYGYWAEYPEYGYCWIPRVSQSWRPYTDGRWAYTDYGWTWVSYEPFGWATCHYGRWWHDPYVGWVWVPGTTWAPAWVAWQYGSGYVGWAALPPESYWSVSVGFSSQPVIPALSWCFVSESRMLDRNVGSRLEHADMNIRILNRTRHATRYEVANGRPVNRGVDVEEIQRGAGRRIDREPVVETRNPGRGRGRGQTAGPIEVFQPELQPARRGEAPPRVREPDRAPAESPGVAQRAEAERRRLERALQEEQSRLEQRQAAEMRDPAAMPRRQEVQRKHEEERQQFKDFSERQRKEFEQRAQVRRKQPPADRDKEKEQRNDRSRRRGNGGGN